MNGLSGVSRWSAALLFAAFAVFFSALLWRFSFVYTDIDQVLMWYGAHEFRNGDVHMLRFFGQNYGSMLEALVAVPLFFLPYHVALPLTTAILLLLPFSLIVFHGGFSRTKLLLVSFLLVVLPLEYFMIGTMPRDFVTGLAVTSLAIPLLHNTKLWARVLFGFLIVLGWSLNHNAALFGATLSAYALMNGFRIDWKSAWKVVVGYLLGLGAHLWLSSFGNAHPEYIVHLAWPFHYHWKQVWDGWTNLDRHFRWITPLLHGQGWFYIALFTGFISYFFWKRRPKAAWAAVALTVVNFAAFGILKVHDGYDSVFLSHERMFLALPVALAFLVSRIEIKHAYVPPVLILIGVGFMVFNMSVLDQRIAEHVDPARKDNRGFLHISHAQVRADCDRLQTLVQNHEAEAVIIYPNGTFTGLHSYACPCFDEETIYVDPEYERKTWDMRTLDTPAFHSVVLITPIYPMDRGVPSDVWIRDVSSESGVKDAYIVRGDAFNPLEVMRSLDFTVSTH